MKVLFLCHSDLVPPARTKKNIEQIDRAAYRTEYYVTKALKELGHDIVVCGLDKSLKPLKKVLKKERPDIVFNMLEEFSGEGLLESFVPSYLESIGQRFTGCNSLGLIQAKNKIASKKILNVIGLKTPGSFKFPKIVKLKNEESSRGISAKSIVRNKREELLVKKVLAKKYKAEAFAEEYIMGRELHVAILIRSEDVVVSPIWETEFSERVRAKIITERAKWDFPYRNKMGIKLVRAERISKSLTKKIQNVAKRACLALDLTGPARVDIRLTSKNEIYVLEVNPNPDLAYGDEYAECMRDAGFGYHELITAVLEG